MELIVRLIGFLNTLFTLAMTIVMLFSFRKERVISTFGPLGAAVLSLLVLPVFILLSGARLNPLLGIPILAVGLLIGFLRGLATRLYYKDGQVVGRNSMLFLLGWGGSLVLAQLLNMGGSALLASVGLMPVFLSTGTQVGLSGNIFLRRLMMTPAPSVPAAEQVRVRLPDQARVSSRPPSLPERERGMSPGPPRAPKSHKRVRPPDLPER